MFCAKGYATAIIAQMTNTFNYLFITQVEKLIPDFQGQLK